MPGAFREVRLRWARASTGRSGASALRATRDVRAARERIGEVRTRREPDRAGAGEEEPRPPAHRCRSDRRRRIATPAGYAWATGPPMANNVPTTGRELMYEEVIATGCSGRERRLPVRLSGGGARGEHVSGKFRPSATNSVAGLLEPSRDANRGVEPIDAVEAHDLVAGLGDGGLDRARESGSPSEQEHRLARGQHPLDLGECSWVERGRPREQSGAATHGRERRAHERVRKGVGSCERHYARGADPGEARLGDPFAVSMRSAPEIRVIVLLDGLTTIGDPVMFVLGFEK